MENKDIIVYGAYGYTGELIVRRCLEQGLKPLLSGRNAKRIQATAEEHRLSCQVCDLSIPSELDSLLNGAKVVIHAAGPFMYTSRPMVEACIRNSVHYTDITGEISVFKQVRGYDSQAKEKGLMLLPGTGFDVVPSDCLAAHLKSRLPEADDLVLAFYGSGKSSRGTNMTIVEGMGYGGTIRQDGRLKMVPDAYDIKRFDFDGRDLTAVTIPWGDVYTAYFSTGIPNIKVYMAMPEKAAKGLRMGRYFGWLMRSRWFKDRLRKKIISGSAGPSYAERGKSFAVLTGTVTDANGNTVTSTIRTQEGYTLTGMTAVHIVEKILQGDFKVGFQTPSLVYGKDVITEASGAAFVDG